jgi:hypothetical protein
MRQKLIGKWSTFIPADKATCVGSEKGGYASYTDLATCREMARDARKLNNRAMPGRVAISNGR